MGNLTTVVNIFITCIVLVQGMADQCTTGPNIVLPCSNMTTPTNQMFIPVNGSILTDGDNGCICDVTVVESPDNSIFTAVSVRIINNNISCGYQVMAGRRIIECQNRSSSSTNINLNQSLSLTFTRDNTPSPPSTAGFCLQVITQNIKFKVTKVCRQIVPIPLTSKPTRTAQPMETTIQTMIETSNTAPLQNATEKRLSTTEAPNATTSLSTREMPQSTESTVKNMSITTDYTSLAPGESNGNNEATIDRLPVIAIGGGTAGGFLLIIIVIIVIVCICKRRKTNDYDKTSGNREDNPYHTNIATDHATVIHKNGGSNGRQQSSTSNHSTTSPWILNPESKPNSLPHDMIIMENNMYISADSILPDRHAQNYNIGTTDTTQLEVEDKPFSLDPNQNVSNMYAVVNKAPKSSNPNRPSISMVPPGSSFKSNESKSPNYEKPRITMANSENSSKPNEFNDNDTVQYADIRFNKTTEL